MILHQVVTRASLEQVRPYTKDEILPWRVINTTASENMPPGWTQMYRTPVAAYARKACQHTGADFDRLTEAARVALDHLHVGHGAAQGGDGGGVEIIAVEWARQRA